MGNSERMKNIALAAYYDFKGFYMLPNEYIEGRRDGVVAGCCIFTKNGLESFSPPAKAAGRRYMKALAEAFPRHTLRLRCCMVSNFCIDFYLNEMEGRK